MPVAERDAQAHADTHALAPAFGARDFMLALIVCLVWAGNFLTSAFAPVSYTHLHVY